MAAPYPNQTDLRRAMSAAYYGVFHFILTAAADMAIQDPSRSSVEYSLAYRSIDHKRFKALCSKLKGSRPSNDILPYAPDGSFGEVADFARLAGNLVELRNFADYDPSRDSTLDDVRTAISEARQAVEKFLKASAEQRKAFLTLLLFTPR